MVRLFRMRHRERSLYETEILPVAGGSSVVNSDNCDFNPERLSLISLGIDFIFLSIGVNLLTSGKICDIILI